VLSPGQDMTETFLHESVRFFTQNAQRFLHGHALHNLVDKSHGY
jgi:hypothetical protein